MTLFIHAITGHNNLNYMNSIIPDYTPLCNSARRRTSLSNISTRIAHLLEAKNGNTRRQGYRKLDNEISHQDGKDRVHMGGHANKLHGGEDEENVKGGNIIIVVYQPTDLIGLMTPGP